MELSDKKAVFVELLKNGDVFMTLDATREGVVVPNQFKISKELTLTFGYNMPIPIRDLAVCDSGVSGTLSFGRSPFYCTIPWSAVFGLYQKDVVQVAWPLEKVVEPAPSKRPVLSVVK